MGNNNLVYLTDEGIKKLTNEMTEIKQILSEKAQRFIEDEEEIAFLQQRLETIQAAISEASHYPSKENKDIGYGSIVTIFDIRSKERLEYMLVDELEANPIDRKISITSPLGKSIISKGAGNIIELNINDEVLLFEVLGVR